MHSPLQSPLQPVMRSPLDFRRRGGGGLGPELVINGDFSSGFSGWSVSGDWVVNASSQAAGSTGQITQDIFSLASTYQIEFDIIGSLAAELIVFAGASTIEFVPSGSSGHVILTMTAAGDGRLIFNPTGAAVIDNVSARAVL